MFLRQTCWGCLHPNCAFDTTQAYPSIPHSAGLSSLKKALEKHFNKQIPTTDLVKMAKFVLSNNYFEFSDKVFQQISL